MDAERTQLELNDRQEEVLAVLVDDYQAAESPITADELAEALDKHTATVRKQMQSLKALSIVEGIPGPRGGYRPTTNAYAALDHRTLDEGETQTLTLARDYERVDVTVEGISFTNVLNPETCRVRLTLGEPVTRFGVGDPIIVGPTPSASLVVAGEVDSVDEAANQLYLDVARLQAPLEA